MFKLTVITIGSSGMIVYWLGFFGGNKSLAIMHEQIKGLVQHHLMLLHTLTRQDVINK